MEDLKDLFKTNLYQSFRQDLNYFRYFGITKQDLFSALDFVKNNYKNREELIKTIEQNIEASLDFLQNNKRDATGAYVRIVDRAEKHENFCYVYGMFLTAMRLMSQELIFLLKRERSNFPEIVVPVIDDDILKYDFRDYRMGLRIFFEGISKWFYKIAINSQALLNAFMNHDAFYDNDIFDLKEFKNLFVWIWMWSNINVTTDFLKFTSEWYPNDFYKFSVSSNVLKPFEFYPSRVEKKYLIETKNEIEQIALWNDDHIGERYENARDSASQRVFYNNEMSYYEFFRALDVAKYTFTLFPGYDAKKYTLILCDAIQKHNHIIVSESKVEELIKNSVFLLRKDASNDISSSFIKNSIYRRPIFCINNFEGDSILTSFPEFIKLSKVMNEVYDFPIQNAEALKKSNTEVFRKFINVEIDKNDKKNTRHFFKYKNSLNFKIKVDKKMGQEILFDNVLFDVSMNSLYLCKVYYSENRPEVWFNWRRDVLVYGGRDNLLKSYLDNFIEPILSHKRKLKREFKINDETNINVILFMNIELEHSFKFKYQDVTIWLINHTQIAYFLKEIIYRKNVPFIDIEEFFRKAIEVDKTFKKEMSKIKKENKAIAKKDKSKTEEISD